MRIFLVGLADLRSGLARPATIRLARHRGRETWGVWKLVMLALDWFENAFDNFAETLL